MKRLLLVTALLFSASTGSFAQNLFDPAEVDREDLNDRQNELLGHLEAMPAFLEADIVTVNLSALDQTSASMIVASRGAISMSRARVEIQPDEDLFTFVWYGHGISANASAILVVRGNQITGTIREAGELFYVRPLTGGLHAVVRVDENRFIDHEPGFSEIEAASAAYWTENDPSEAIAQAGPSNVGGNIIYLIVGYTPLAAAQVGDIDALVLLAIAETNTGYANSNIEPRVALAHKFQTIQNGSGSFGTDVPRLIATSDGWFDEIHGLRDDHGADVGLLITRDYGGACGQASSILAASAAMAFAALSQTCATGFYTFAHEIGHLQGARHNPEADPSSAPFAYGHGKYFPAGSWRTVMSYNCPSGCTRVTQWSNPDVNYLGNPTGDITLRDNARVLDETAAYIADFRPDPIPVELVSFEGILDHQLVRLSWATSSETNNAGFEVQRAGDSGWEALGFVTGNGTTTEAHTYAFTDAAISASAGSVSYRLKQIDFDGAFELSGRIEVELSAPTDFALVGAHPNPFNPSTSVQFTLPAAADVRIDVLDALGRRVATLVEGPMEAGYFTANWEASGSPSGTYVIRMLANGRTTSRRVTLLK